MLKTLSGPAVRYPTQQRDQLKELLAEEQAFQAHTRRQQRYQQPTEQLTQLPSDDAMPRAAVNRPLAWLQRLDERYEIARLSRAADDRQSDLGDPKRATVEGLPGARPSGAALSPSL